MRKKVMNTVGAFIGAPRIALAERRAEGDTRGDAQGDARVADGDPRC